MPLLRLDGHALETYLGTRLIPFTRGRDGALRVPIKLKTGVVVTAELRGSLPRRLFECVTMLPLPLAPGREEAVAAELASLNRTLPASRFVARGGDIFHVATAEIDEDGALSSRLVDLSIANTRVACDRLLRALGRCLVRGESDRLDGDQLAELRLEAATRRPSFAPRLDGHLMVEEVENCWFRKHRILLVQSPSPAPAMSMVVAVTPDRHVRVLAGQAAALNEVASAEGIALTDDGDARGYANLVTSWTRSADFVEMPVGSFEEIPFRRDLPADVRRELERLGRDLAGQLAPLSFARTDRGWRLVVWLLSVSRLVRRVADVRRDGTLEVREEVAAPALPVPPGETWAMYGGRYIPVG